MPSLHQPRPTVRLRLDDDDADAKAQRRQRTRHRLRLLAICAGAIAIAIALLILLASWAWRALFVQNDRLLLKHIDFTDTPHYATAPRHGRISVATILSEAGIDVNRTNLLTIDLERLQQLFRTQHPLLGHIRISKVMPDTLRIEASEHSPAAMLVVHPSRNAAPLRFPIAVAEHTLDPTDARGTPAPVILLPSTISLFDERTHASVPWNYALYPDSFERRTINTALPQLFGFNALGVDLVPGAVVRSRQLNAALKLIRLTGVTSSNAFFAIDQITLIPPATLRVLVSPFRQCRRLMPLCQLDFSADNLSEERVARVLTFIAAAEGDPASRPIRYLNATGDSLFASPDAIP